MNNFSRPWSQRLQASHVSNSANAKSSTLRGTSPNAAFCAQLWATLWFRWPGERRVRTLLRRGDEVLIPVPYFPMHPVLTDLAGGVPIFVPSPDGVAFDAGAAERLVTKKTTESDQCRR
ncbi:MAG: aminotransferase class I/II-fold pyridoxal phosphate-dependent enzyme [Phycisphaerales bacterium]